MKDSLHTLIYSAVLGLVCALLLTGAAEITKPYRQRNAQVEKIRNILSVLEVPFGSSGSPQELVDTFNKNVHEAKNGQLVMYAYSPPGSEGKAEAWAVPFAGPGLWGPVKGLLALEPDMQTIRGITFYEQEETPGLGGEIAAVCPAGAKVHQVETCPAWFRHQFKGKSIYDAAKRPGIHIRQGGAKGRNEVDAITGATMTSQKVEEMLNNVIRRIAEERNSHGR